MASRFEAAVAFSDGRQANSDRRWFLHRFHMFGTSPSSLRDVVTRAIETEIREGRGYGEGLGAYVLLDVRHLGKDKILKALPKIRHVR